MLLIAAINVTIGMCTYDEPPPPQRIELRIPGHEDNRLIPVGQIPAR
jgi:hypothetical protein